MSGMAKNSSNGGEKQYWRPCCTSSVGGGKVFKWDPISALGLL